MKLAKIISMAWIFLAVYIPDQDNLLNQKVSLSYQQTGIEQILHDLQQQYNIRFSYINNEIPNNIRVTIQLEDQPLYVALDEVLKETSLGYRVVNGQVILKKDLHKAKKVEAKPAAAASDSTPKQNPQPVSVVEEKSETEEAAVLAQKPDQHATASIGQEATIVKPLAKEEAKVEVPQQEEVVPAAQPKPARQDERPHIPTRKKEEKSNLGKSIEKFGVGLRNLFQQLPSEDENDYERRAFHIGIIYPLSTNGTDAGKYVNELSFHWLVGYAAGLDGVEFSGFGNIENDFVHGVQGSGFFNLVKNDVEGVQLAGFMNLNGGEMQGAQFSGFLNTTAGSVNGVQGSGFANIVTGYTEGAQFAGFMNLVSDDAKALQSAGFANITTGDMAGVQFSGFMNYSRDINVQMAGFINVASGEVNGIQASGFMNIADNVKGVQLGVFNVADSVSGVPIGLLSIVRKNGYRRLEVWSGETLQANLGFKIGVEKFYNIFAFGSQFADENFRWGLGYGVGTQIGITSRDYLNLDLMSFQIREAGDQWFVAEDLNLLNTLRLAYSHQFSEHFSLFVAPTFNVMVSQRQNSSDGSIGTDIAPWTVFDETYNNNTNVQMWPGFHAGIRF